MDKHECTIERVSWSLSTILFPNKSPIHPNIVKLAILDNIEHYGLISNHKVINISNFIMRLPSSCKEGYVVIKNGLAIEFLDMSDKYNVVWG